MDRTKESLSQEKTDKAEVTYGQVVKYTGAFGGVQGLTMLVSVLRNKLAAILLGPSGMGLVVMYNSVTSFMANISNLGLSTSGVRQISEYYEQETQKELSDFVRVIRTWGVWTALAGVVLSVLFAPVISYLAFDGSFAYTGSLILLAPVVGFTAIMGAELAVLKGTRHLKRVVLISALGAVTTLLTTIPFYYFFGIKGIVGALVLSSLVLAGVHVYYSAQVYPWHISFWDYGVFRKGKNMVRLGVAFVLAAVAGSLAELIIPSLLFRLGSLSDVAFYRLGYSLIVTYAGIVFVAMEADYYPRLSAVYEDRDKYNRIVNQQLEVCVMLMGPVLVFFMLAMPFVVRLLYSSEYLALVDMAVCAAVYMLFKAATLPVAYLALAKGDSLMFLAMDLVYYLFLVVAVVTGYYWGGLFGAGIALAVAGVFDFLLIHIVYTRRYGFRLKREPFVLFLGQLVLVLLTLYLCLQDDVLMKYISGTFIFCISMYLSFRILRRHTKIWERIRKRFSGDKTNHNL